MAVSEHAGKSGRLGKAVHNNAWEPGRPSMHGHMAITLHWQSLAGCRDSDSTAGEGGRDTAVHTRATASFPASPSPPEMASWQIHPS